MQTGNANQIQFEQLELASEEHILIPTKCQYPHKEKRGGGQV